MKYLLPKLCIACLLLCQSIADGQTVFSVGNSLTVDSLPLNINGSPRAHLYCGRNLQYIRDNPDGHCVDSSTPWPLAFANFDFDTVVVQPFIGTTLEQDATIISEWMSLEPNANFVLNTGWPGESNFESDLLSANNTNIAQSSIAYFADLIAELKIRNPGRSISTTRTNEILYSILLDVQNGIGPIENFNDLYRDPIHLDRTVGRYVAHNALRRSLGQPLINVTNLDPSLSSYFDSKINAVNPSSTVLGDVNLDGVVDFLDISPFISILITRGFQTEADCDQDLNVNFNDIFPFIQLLTRGN